MKSFLALALTAYVSTLVAQDKPAAAATQWTQLREAFAEAQAGEYAAVIAVVDGGEPLILTVGSDSSGKDLAPQTLVPLLALAKVLAADAVHVQLKGNLEQAVGGKLGERAPTVRELLHGLPALPDFFVLDGGQELADIDLLQKCGTAAAVANVEPQASRLGASEFVLLEPMVLGERHKNWSAMVRTTLSPHIGGLDPVSADAVVGQQRSMLPTAEDLAKLATAQPALLRTMLSLKDLGTWMQWRVRQDAPLWASARMGAMVASRRMPGRAFLRLKAGPGILAKESMSDLAQSVCRDVLENADRFRYGGEPEFRKWLFATAMRKIADRHEHWQTQKRRAAREQAIDDAADLQGLAAIYTPSQQAMAREELARVEAAFSRLAPEKQEVILMSRLMGMSHAKIAVELGKSEVAVRAMLSRALAEMAAGM